jgi:hypothetical protein
MKKHAALFAMVLSLAAFARADEIQFTALPQVVQSTVIRETHIPGPTAVTHVVRQNGGVYAVTVRQSDASRVLYVNDAGVIMTAPTTVTTTTTEPVEQEVITYEQVQQDLPRYQLIKKERDKEIYLDRQTGKKVKIERKD